MMLQIQKVAELPVDALTDLLLESSNFGFNTIRRLIADWTAGTNRFDRPGEALFLAQDGDRTIGTCGLNLDPYAQSATIGRVRRLYVLSDYRRQGVGRRLVEQVISEACLRFERLHVRTDTSIGDLFYRSLGFIPEPNNETVTHTLPLKTNRLDGKQIILPDM